MDDNDARAMLRAWVTAAVFLGVVGAIGIAIKNYIEHGASNHTKSNKAPVYQVDYEIIIHDIETALQKPYPCDNGHNIRDMHTRLQFIPRGHTLFPRAMALSERLEECRKDFAAQVRKHARELADVALQNTITQINAQLYPMVVTNPSAGILVISGAPRDWRRSADTVQVMKDMQFVSIREIRIADKRGRVFDKVQVEDPLPRLIEDAVLETMSGLRLHKPLRIKP